VIPGAVKHLVFAEGSLLREFDFPEDLESLDMLELGGSREARVLVESGKLPTKKLRRLCIRVDENAPQFVLGLTNITQLILDLGNRSTSYGVLQFPPQLRELELRYMKGVDFAEIGKCSELRKLVLCSCSCAKQNWSLLPQKLFYIFVYGKCYFDKVNLQPDRAMQWRMSVDDWIRLSPFCVTIPRLDSVMEGLMLFSEISK
jgi:hypothetical protein